MYILEKKKEVGTKQTLMGVVFHREVFKLFFYDNSFTTF